MKPAQLSWITAALLGLSTMAHAGFDGASSDPTVRTVGESTVDAWIIHTPGKAGIGSSADKLVDFEGLKNQTGWLFGAFGTSRYDSDNLTGEDIGARVYTSGSQHFSKTHYNFVQVANQDVWFGEWYEGDRDVTFNSRVVYYVGDDTGTSVPTSGTASYAVTGVNKFSGENILAGTFTADFGAQSLTGSVQNAALKVNVNAQINVTTAAFNGSASADVNGVTTNGGTSQGHFFGANANSLAGIATFTNSDLDTAFGGSKK